MAWLAGRPLLGLGYQPRHRSPRWDQLDEQILADLSPAADIPPAQPAQPESAAGLSRPSDNGEGSHFLDELTRGQVRRILECSAINDNLANAVPELIALVAHPSHTNATLTGAWTEFQQATRDAYALRVGRRAWREFFPQELGSPRPQGEAVTIKLGVADGAWCLITSSRS